MENAIVYIYLFVIIPLLLFTGISILTKKDEFRLFPLFSIIILGLVLIIHTHAIFNSIKSLFTGEKIQIQPEFGVFIIVLAIALLILNGYMLISKNKY
jgi:hypothetical protein